MRLVHTKRIYFICNLKNIFSQETNKSTVKYLIIFSDDCDQEVDKVMKYLYANSKLELIRINNLEELSSKLIIEIINKPSLYVFWIARIVHFLDSSIPKNIFLDEQEIFEQEWLLNNEKKRYLEYILNINSDRIIGNQISPNLINKLLVLHNGNKLGINIPNTFISDNLFELKSILSENNELISKSIDRIFNFNIKEDYYMTYTEEINYLNIDFLPDKFGVSMFQENLIKEYEVRSFYFYGTIWSVAIFSSINNQTKSDFRKYDNVKPNRVEPIKLPDLLESKISLLMNKMRLNTGSLDLTFSQEKGFTLLEINPEGRLGFVNNYTSCYYLEKIIANCIINKVNILDDI